MSYQYHPGKMYSGRFLRIYLSIASKLCKSGESFGNIVKRNMFYGSDNNLRQRRVNMNQWKHCESQWRIQDFPEGGGVNPPGGA